jgi:hypothetical protein
VGGAVNGGVRTAQRLPAAVNGATGAAGAQLRSNLGTAAGVNAATGAGAAGIGANARLGAAAGLNANGNVRTALRPNLGANAGGAYAARWHNLTPQQRATIHANVRNAVAANMAAKAGITNGLANPAQYGVWSGWGNGIRSNYLVGGSPFFGGSPFYTGNFFSGRNLLGLGLMGAGLPGLGSAVAGYPIGGYGIGGMGMGWGYSPWMGYQPWNYWWSNPGWNGLAGYMGGGLNQPYFYDYGAGGNVVYSGNQVLVNGQDVGTPSQYAQSAADLAAVDPAAIAQSNPKDWMALGTFSLATAQDEANPPRVIQLAVNKEDLISGTVYNRNSDKLYTVQGRVDPQTQRVAFTIGDHTDTVLETGLYNLTQEQTPVLVHYGPEKTATYLMARLPAPEGSQVEAQATQNANAAAALPGINR